MDDAEHSYPRRQAELAQEASAPSLFWLPEDLDLTTLDDDADHRDWLHAIETDACSDTGYQLQRSSSVRLVEDALEQIAGLYSDHADTRAGRTIVGGAQESEGAKATSEVRRPPGSRGAERFVGVRAAACAKT